MSGKRAIFTATLLSFFAALLAGSGAAAADRYDAAVSHPGRSAADLERDPKDKPAEVLRLSGIGAGMHVVDVLGGNGYYSEILSYLVGPTGEVRLVNNAGFDGYDPTWKERLAGGRLPNVTHRVVDLSAMQLGTATFDAALLIKVYHDLYWKELTDGPPKTDAKTVLDQVQRPSSRVACSWLSIILPRRAPARRMPALCIALMRFTRGAIWSRTVSSS